MRDCGCRYLKLVNVGQKTIARGCSGYIMSQVRAAAANNNNEDDVCRGLKRIFDLIMHAMDVPPIYLCLQLTFYLQNVHIEPRRYHALLF
jgi:hypothetical protein